MPKTTDKVTSILLNIALWLTCLLYLFPLLWLFLSSVKPGSELFIYPLTIWPKTWQFSNFVDAWQRLDFFQYFKNTFLTASIATALTVFISATCGYALAKYDYKWLKFFFLCILATTMVPTEVIMNPTFVVIRNLGLYDSLAGIIIPTINTATGIFMFRQFFQSIPDDMLDSARIDGASEGRIFFSIMFPLAKPIVITLAIFSFQWRWNDYIWPLIVLNDQKKYTLQVALRSIVGAQNINWTMLLSASVLSIIPLLLLFLVFQRYIIGSDATSGIKG